MSNITVTVDQLNQLQATDIVNQPAVRDRFIQIYDALWGEGTGAAAYERESIYFNKIVGDNENLKTKVTRFSIFASFIDLAVCGLSLEPGARAQCYLQPRKVETGATPDGRKTYEGRCTLSISGYGELYMRERAGQIRHADNPVLVYEEDSFSFSERNGQKSVDYTCRIPHTTRHIVAGFIKITRADGTIDYFVMYEEDWDRLKDYSGKQNKFWDREKGCWVERPNALYSSGAAGGIDTGFLCAKIIKHAFRSYPKLRIGKATDFQASEPAAPQDDFYTLGAPVQSEKAPQEPAPQPFGGPANNLAQGVTVEPGDDGAF